MAKKSHLTATKGKGKANLPFSLRPVPEKPLTGNAAAAAQIPVGFALLQDEHDDNLSLLCEIEGYPRLVAGFGGWEDTKRRGAVALTTFSGYDPLAYELDLYLDDFDAGDSIEKSVKVLRALGGRGPLAKPGDPPRLVVNTAGLMDGDSTEFPAVRWVIDALAPDEDQVIVNSVGERTRAPITITIKQYVAPQRLKGRSKAKKGATRVVKAKTGDTLISIARRELGDASRWPEIKKLNPKLRDPRKKIKAHTPVKLP
jgi:LysM repeat protein